MHSRRRELCAISKQCDGTVEYQLGVASVAEYENNVATVGFIQGGACTEMPAGNKAATGGNGLVVLLM